MSEIESAYLERDQIQSTSLRDEYLQVYCISLFTLKWVNNKLVHYFGYNIIFFHAAFSPQ
jgi:hypothetical protein